MISEWYSLEIIGRHVRFSNDQQLAWQLDRILVACRLTTRSRGTYSQTEVQTFDRIDSNLLSNKRCQRTSSTVVGLTPTSSPTLSVRSTNLLTRHGTFKPILIGKVQWLGSNRSSGKALEHHQQQRKSTVRTFEDGDWMKRWWRSASV